MNGNKTEKLEIIKQKYPYTIDDGEREYYFDEEMMNKFYDFLRECYNEIDLNTGLRHLLQEKDLEEKTVEQLRSELGLNHNIQYKDFVIVSSFKIRECQNNNHYIRQLKIDIPIVHKNSKISEKTILAYHCSNCKLYFISENDYWNIKKQGSILCQHMTWEEYEKNIKGSGNNFSQWQQYSLLNRFGYSVNQKDNLSENQRHSILSYVIENEPKDFDGYIWNRNKIVSFLNHQIKMHPHSWKAIKKWEEDLDFLEDYSHKNPIVYEIRRLICNR